jgi:hypothetical protein
MMRIMAQRFIAKMAGIVQSTGGKYHSDNWGTTTLWPGDRVWGGVPHPTEYFTDWATIAEHAEFGWAHSIWDALQVAPHHGTVRGGVAEYEVLYGISVPYARCLNNSQFGMGGGYQYIIPHPDHCLRRTGYQIWFGDSNNQLAPSLLP